MSLSSFDMITLGRRVYYIDMQTRQARDASQVIPKLAVEIHALPKKLSSVGNVLFLKPQGVV